MLDNKLSAPTDPSNPRVDMVVKNGTEGMVLLGIPTAGATLENRLGCAAPPPGWEVKGYVLVPANATTIPEANIMPNLWTPEIDAAVARIEAEIRR